MKKNHEKGNLGLACFVTAYARIKLYRTLEVTGGYSFYVDTDSILYRSIKGVCELPESNQLGGLVSETPGTFVSEFVAAGPKSYAYRTAAGDSVVKVKGISLTPRNSSKINFQTLKDMVLNDQNTQITAEIPFSIRRDVTQGKLLVGPSEFFFKYTYDKRYVDEGQKTLPWGYAGSN